MLKFYEVSFSVNNKKDIYKTIMTIVATTAERAKELILEKFKNQSASNILIEEIQIKEGTFFTYYKGV